MDSDTHQFLAQDLLTRLRASTFLTMLISFFIVYSFVSVVLSINLYNIHNHQLPVHIHTYNELLAEFKSQKTKPDGLMRDATRECIKIDTSYLTVHLAYELVEDCQTVWSETIHEFYGDEDGFVFDEFKNINRRSDSNNYENSDLAEETLIKLKAVHEKILTSTADNPLLISNIVRFHHSLYSMLRDLGNISVASIGNWSASADLSINTLMPKEQNSSSIFGFSFDWGLKSSSVVFFILIICELSLLSFLSQIRKLKIERLNLSSFILFHKTKSSRFLRILFYCALVIAKLITTGLVFFWVDSNFHSHVDRFIEIIAYIFIILMFFCSLIPTYFIQKETKEAIFCH